MQQSMITSKGQVTIPIAIRKMFNLHSGHQLKFIPEDGQIVIVPLNNGITSLRGMLPKPERALSCEEMNQVIRDSYAGN